MPAYTLRAARAGETAALTALARAAKARWGYPAAWLDAWRDELAFTPSSLADMRVVVAERSGADGPLLLGVAALARRDDGWSLEHLWVAPAAEGAGVGRALFAALVQEAAAGGGGTIEVLSDPHAAAFYERLGAMRAGSTPAPMPGAPDRVLPRLEYHVLGAS